MPDKKYEIERITSIYSQRDRIGKARLYRWTEEDVHIQKYELHVQVVKYLKKLDIYDLYEKEILDMGCGDGSWLRTLLEWGGEQDRLHGIDLLPDRIERAKLLSPNVDLRVESAWETHYKEDSFDLIFAYTIFSSILDPNIRELVAREIMRIIKPNGVLFIFDFKISSPGNKDTTGINVKEINRLFPEMSMLSSSLILAPPLMRKIAPLSPLLVLFLERIFPFLKSHMIHCLYKAT